MSSGNSIQVRSEPDQAVRDVVAAVGATWATGDVDGFAALYAPDATVVLPGGVQLEGRSAIRNFTAPGFAGPLKGTKAVNADVQVRMITDDVAIVTSLGGTQLAGETEVAAERARRATWVLARRDGSWLIEVYSTCPTGPA
jgi:uncharacterized protein (TIGR02246 family)